MRITKMLNDSRASVSGVEAGGWAGVLCWRVYTGVSRTMQLADDDAVRCMLLALARVCITSTLLYSPLEQSLEASHRVRRLRVALRTRVQGLGFVFSS